MDMYCENKVALVTGASRGIGAAIADELGKRGAKVFGTATSEQGTDKIMQRFKEAGIDGEGIVLNVTDENSIQATLDYVKDHAGMPDILVNNAGITRDNLMLIMKPEEWQDVISTNLTAVYRMTQACLRPMIKKRWGRIINISSVVGTTGNAGQANYSAAKAGLIGFTKSTAQEVAKRGVTLNVVAPGFIETDMTGKLTDEQKAQIMSAIPMKSMGKPEDIANAVSFLASPFANYITGETLHVNGGMFMS